MQVQSEPFSIDLDARPFSPLRITKVDGDDHGRQLWALLDPLEFRLGVNGGSLWVTVPAKFLTDFASVPRLLWPLCPPAGQWCEAAVVHDYLCRTVTCSRFLADAVFREAMARLGVPLWRRVLMYYAVRCYGVCLSIMGSQ